MFEPTDNSLIGRVRGEWSATDEVVVEFGNGDTGPLRTAPARVEDGAYEVNVARLRPETAYEFQVFGVGLDGEDVPGPTGTFETGSLPPGLQRVQFNVVEGAASSDLTLMDLNLVEWEGQPAFTGLVAIDSASEIVWYSKSPGETNAMARQDNGNFVYIDHSFGLREVTPLGEPVAEMQSSCVPIVYHHEVEVLPDGSVLTMGFDVRDTFDDADRLQVGDTIWRWDPQTGAMDEVWSIHDVEDATANRTDDSDIPEGFMWRGCDEDLPTQDWTHGNSVKLAPDGSFVVSSRHLDQVHSISSDFGSVNWRLGGEGSSFDFPDPADRFYHQHSPRQLENGNILLFDNGNTRPEEEGGHYSRALELELDFESMTAQRVWEYVADPAIYSPCCASLERLDNDNTLMIFPGDTYEEDICCRVQTIVEADPAQRTVWKTEVTGPGISVIYRAYAGDSILGEERVSAVP